MMQDAIINFPKQLAYEPVIENGRLTDNYTKYILVGMGGSHLAADLISMIDPSVPLRIYSDYGLPYLSPVRASETLIILSSYSGNTEEVLESFYEAKNKGLPMVAMAAGGKLLELAKENSIPYIQLPNTGIQPRSALGFSLIALLKILGLESAIRRCHEIGATLNAGVLEKKGLELAVNLKGFSPVIYSSLVNSPIAYNWKIKFNETGKIPAFCNVLPELNHNEMNGFDVVESSKALSEKFYFILLRDANDHPQIKKRMDVIKKLYQDRDLKVLEVNLDGHDILEKIFTSLLTADWAAVNIADYYGLESEQVPMVEEFKRLIEN